MDARDIAALEAAGLGGRPARAEEIEDGGTALVVPVDPAEMLDVWRTARAAVDRTGRWPVLCERDDDVFSRFYFEEGAQGEPYDPASILARAEALHAEPGALDARLTALNSAYPDGDPDAAWPPRQEAPDGPPGTGVQDWYGTTDIPLDLALLPSAEPWSVFAYVNALYDTCGYGHDVLAAAARRWHDHHGAEPVAALGVTAWLTVPRPPADPAAAWRTAFEHHVLAENTTATPALTVREHAEMLPALHTWVLFSRP